LNSWDLDKENDEKAWKYASLCIKTKHFEKSIEPLTYLVEKSPDVVNYWRELAHAYDKLSETDKSIHAYKKLIELEPDNKVNYVNLAIIYKKLEQLSVSRSYLLKAISKDKNWDYPYWIEGQLYEQAARNCGFDFIDKCVYQLAVNKYKKAASLGGTYQLQASQRAKALSQSVPTQEDYFFRNLKSGDKIKIEGKCYNWINREITVP
jgi:tetratricopeptide (TPR) repeat protein